MKKTAIRYGLIGGAIIVVFMFASMPFMLGSDNVKPKYGELLGYLSMIISLSTIFFGIRSYRDSHLGGSIPFKKAFQLGLYITLIASAMYVIGWMIYSGIFIPDFMEQYAAQTIEEMRSSGASVQEIEEQQKVMDKYIEQYKNPLFKMGITFMEIFPVGLVVSLVSAAILRKNREA